MMHLVESTNTTTSACAPEQPLIARLRQGENAAYEFLVRKYGPAMLAVARRMLRNEDDAHDVLQDAFRQAFNGIHSFRAGAKLSTWLHRIVVNAALMRMRSASRRREDSLDDLLPTFTDDGHHTDAAAATLPSPEDAVARREVRTRVRACIAQLPTPYRTVIVLRDLEDADTNETAIVLGISENAVKIRLHRARQALMTLLQREQLAA